METMNMNDDKRQDGMEMPSHTHYLIDLENTGCRWAGIIPRIRRGDTVTVFISDKTTKLESDALCAAYRNGAGFRFLSCENGRANAMDFQMMVELGRLSVQEPASRFRMVTADKGFESVVKYMADLGIDALRMDPCLVPSDACGNVCVHATATVDPPEPPEPLEQGCAAQEGAPGKEDGAGQKTVPEIPTPEHATKRFYINLLRQEGLESQEDLTVSAAIIYEAMKMPENRRKLNAMNRFQSRYGMKDGTERYKALRELIKKIAEEGPFPPKDEPLKEAPDGRIYPKIDKNDVNGILSSSGIVMVKGTTAKTMECIETARMDQNPQEALRTLMTDYLTPKQVNKALPKLVKYL